MDEDLQKKEEEEARRSELWEKIKKESKQVQKEFKAHEDVKNMNFKCQERRKIETKERNFSRKESSIDVKLKAATGPLRVRCIGQDRFFNRYWYFDGSIGIRTSLEANFFAPRDKYRKNSLYASGCLFVEDFGLHSSVNWQDPSLDNIKTGNVSGKWGYYSEPNQLTQLKDWLDVRGVRERNLINNLEKIEDLIFDGMEQRSKDIGQYIHYAELKITICNDISYN